MGGYAETLTLLHFFRREIPFKPFDLERRKRIILIEESPIKIVQEIVFPDPVPRTEQEYWQYRIFGMWREEGIIRGHWEDIRDKRISEILWNARVFVVKKFGEILAKEGYKYCNIAVSTKSLKGENPKTRFQKKMALNGFLIIGENLYWEVKLPNCPINIYLVFSKSPEVIT